MLSWTRRRATLLAAAALGGCGVAHVDYCALGATSTLVFVDETTPYDEADQREITRIFTRIVQSLGVGDRLTLRTIGAKYAESREVFDSCKPGCPPNSNGVASFLGTDCSPSQTQIDLDGFLGKLIRDMQPLIHSTQEARYSDIMGTLAHWTRGIADGRQYREIIVYSDMLENTPNRPWTTFQRLSSAAMLEAATSARLLPQTTGATVRIFGFGRSHGPGRPALPTSIDNELRAFWEQFFLAGGAERVLYGVPPGR